VSAILRDGPLLGASAVVSNRLLFALMRSVRTCPFRRAVAPTRALPPNHALERLRAGHAGAAARAAVTGAAPSAARDCVVLTAVAIARIVVAAVGVALPLDQSAACEFAIERVDQALALRRGGEPWCGSRGGAAQFVRASAARPMRAMSGWFPPPPRVPLHMPPRHRDLPRAHVRTCGWRGSGADLDARQMPLVERGGVCSVPP
jgi:hypothetical protein